MDMDAPLPSQASQPNFPQIFKNEDGSSMQIFTEAGGIQGRPLLMRKLRGHGGAICTDPRSAQIILVNPNTSQGRHFIRDWGSDESKAVLEYTWVNKCIEEGKVLAADEDWGDSVARDDGLEIGEDNDEDEIQKSPLPTPRVTPVERKGSISRGPEPVLRSSIVANHQAQREPSLMPPSTPSASSSNAGVIPSMAGVSQNMPTFNSMLPGNSMSQAQFPMQMAAMMNPMLMQQMFAAMMMNQPGVQYNEEFKLALGDIMKFNPNSPMQPPMYNQAGIRSPVQEQALPFPVVPTKSQSARRSASEFSDSISLHSVDKKGKQRAVSPAPKRRKRSPSPEYNESYRKSYGPLSGDSHQKNIFTKSGRPLAFFVQIDLHNRFSVVDAIKKHGGRIEKDQDLADYVILYTANKRQKTYTDLLKAAQLSQKIAVPSKYVHDCVEHGVLLPSLPYEFDSIVHGKRKRKESPMMGTTSSHEMEKQEEKRRKRNERLSEIRREKRFEQATVGSASSSQAKTKEKEHQITTSANAVDSTVTGRRTPPIPGEHTRQAWGNGYRFSLAETEFALKYAQVLLERDHTISASAITNEIYKKLPHHTLKSWRFHFSKVSQADLDGWRKRASIAFRKAHRQSQPAPSAATPQPPHEEPIDIRFSSSPVPTQGSQQHTSAGSNGVHNSHTSNGVSAEELKLLQEDDLNIISHFFADVDENEDEDAVWVRLASSHRCQTEVDWQKFYANNFEAVQDRHAEITAGTQ